METGMSISTMDHPSNSGLLRSIEDKISSIDLKIHGQYNTDQLKNVRQNIKEYLKRAGSIYDEYVYVDPYMSEPEKKPKTRNESVYEEIDKKIQRLATSKQDYDRTEIYIDLYSEYKKLEYNFKTAAKETKNYINEDEFENSKDTCKILLCKNVRVMEDIINKICTNNIDKSIISGDQQFDSIRYGFEWLYCRENIGENNSGENERRHLDARDSNRFMDYIKYQIMVASKYVKNSPKSSEEIDDLFENIKSVYETSDYERKQNDIKAFKADTKRLIEIFFEAYKCLVNYRDSLFLEEEIRNVLKNSELEAERDEAEKPYKEEINLKAVNLSSVTVRVLLDRFVSFVKISDLNFGNSTFKRAWFNYSELSKSNYAGSNFKYTRIENARMKDCDISTCDMTLADAGNTDFTGSNFTYSNLCGINFVNATLNYCEFQNATFTDVNLSSYKKAVRHLFYKSTEQFYENSPHVLYRCWRDEKYLLNNSFRDVNSIISTINGDSFDCDFDLDISSGKYSWNIFDYIPQLVNSLTVLAGDKMKNIVRHFLSNCISTELLDYIRKMFAKENEERYKDRIHSNGKVYLDAANLMSTSIKYSQMTGNDLSRVKLSDGSFENSDFSSVSMYYSIAESSSFIYCNLNHVTCFESNFYLSNFTNSVINSGIYCNCNLAHTNWNKAILISSIFADLTEYRNSCLNDIDSEHRLFIQDCVQSKPVNNVNVILDLPVYDNFTVDSGEANKINYKFWQKTCTLNDATFVDSLADRCVFLNIMADRGIFNHASFKDSFWFNCRTYLADFIETDFRRSKLSFCCMGQSNFQGANLTSVYVQYVDFSDCNFSSALFNISTIDHALFSGANTRSINFGKALIKNSGFENCKLDHVILSGTYFKNCVFSHVDFIDLIGYHSSIFENCYFYDCTFSRGRKRSAVEAGIQDLRKLFPD